MLVLTLKEQEIKPGYFDTWELCFDPQNGKSFIRRTARQNDDEIFSQRMSVGRNPKLITTKLIELGFQEEQIRAQTSHQHS